MEIGNLISKGVEHSFDTYDMGMPPAMYNIPFGSKTNLYTNIQMKNGAE